VAGADTGGVVRHRFAGRELDQETGLYYMRDRYYDPQLGRFLSEDRAGKQGAANLYEYVESNPVNNRDPSGKILVRSVGGGFSGGSTPGINESEPSGLVSGSALWSLLYFGSTDFAFMDDLDTFGPGKGKGRGDPILVRHGTDTDVVRRCVEAGMAVRTGTARALFGLPLFPLEQIFNGRLPDLWGMPLPDVREFFHSEGWGFLREGLRQALPAFAVYKELGCAGNVFLP
jgi:RHS repeat-associated protein